MQVTTALLLRFAQVQSSAGSTTCLLCAGTLRKVVCEQSLLSRRKRYTDLQAAQWLFNIASALEHMHSQSSPVVHRDLKLENIFLRSTPPRCCWQLSAA